MAGRYDTLVSLFRLLSEEKAAEGRDQDLRRSSFTRHDVKDVRLKNNEIAFVLNDGRSWEGRPDGLRWSEIHELGDWAEVKAVEESIGIGSRKRKR